MTSATFPLGRIAGIRVGAHWSVLIVMGLLADLLATTVLPLGARGSPVAVNWTVAAASALVFLASLLAHELCHALVARHYGLRAERITLWLLGGAAELPEEPPTPRSALLIAAAGPAASLVVGGGFLGAGALASPVLPAVVTVALTWLGWANGVLAVFNLLPGTPLDGGRILEAVAWRLTGNRTRARRIAAAGGQVLASALAAFGAWQILALGTLSGLWMIAISWFLAVAARAELSAAPLRQLLSRLRLRDVMSTDPVTAPGWYTVQGFLDQAAHTRFRTFPVVTFTGTPVGAVSLSALSRVPETERTATRLEDICVKPPACLIAGPDTPLSEVLSSVRLRPGQDLVLVVEHGALVGVAAPGDLAQALELAGLGIRPAHDAGSVK
ncbi:site-2 protease family protein [Amycolatopsis sp. FU40]|uniref:site-2 protease family protein n=1 Tax=Amycolatopsis sp. FU40 TaxID=2914159 RepID=UPI001F45652C|nr:site-2 protease family protein [Amycolatopsis sp. FU40]UKD57398.1 site-2 protease family protein [Amycolatopsis sp. FU40]